MPGVCMLLLDLKRNCRCSPVSHDRFHNFGTHAAQVVQEIVPSSEQGGTYVKAGEGAHMSRHVLLSPPCDCHSAVHLD